MINYSNLENVKLHHTAVALGKFDGLHRGHQLLFSKLASYKEQGYTTVIFTFDFHPANLLTGQRQQVIYTRRERHDIIESLGADILVEFPFTKETAHMLPEDFVRKILIDAIGTEVIVVGNDFHFGYQRSGDLSFLKKNEEKYGYKVDNCEKLCINDQEISATLIRDMIRLGDMEYVSELLGRNYSVSGTVVHGKGNGRKVEMPTANLIPGAVKLLPPDGVYISRTYFDDGSSYDSVTNIGTNPTISEENERSVETFIFDFHADIYGRKIRVDLFKRLRGEEKYDSLEKLAEQVEKDKQDAADYFRGISI